MWATKGQLATARALADCNGMGSQDEKDLLEYGIPSIGDCEGGTTAFPAVDPKRIVLDGKISTCSPLRVPQQPHPILCATSEATI